MSDDFEPRVQRWLRERGEVDPATVETVVGRVAALPPRRTRPRRGWLTAAAAVTVTVIALGVGFVWLPQPQTHGPGPLPPDPAAFAGDPRLAACFGGTGQVQYAFEMTHARDYRRYLPNMGLAPELDVDDPAFVVVFGAGVSPNVGVLGAPGASTGPQTAPPPSPRYVCILLADTPNLYSGVDITGLRATIEESPAVPTSPAPSDVLPDPSAFRDDPRFTACVGSADSESAFEVAHARDVRRYLPSFTGREPELDTDLPALVVIMGADYPAPPRPGPSGAEPPPSSGPTDRYVCIVVGPRNGPAVPGYYFASITGFDPRPAGLETPPPAAASPSREPGPAWAADLAGQLDCEGAIPESGGEVGVFPAIEPASSPDAALKALLNPAAFASLPARGFEPAQVEGHWARYGYFVDGRRKALVVASDQVEGIPDGSGWFVVGVRSCDVSEFDPADGRTFDLTLWLSASGKIARSDIIHSSAGPGHCGWESVIFLQFDGAQYLRDPKGVLADSTIVPFKRHVSLPRNAEDTGYHTPDWHLFRAPAGDAVYVRTKDGTFERWGRARDEVGCA